MRREAVRAWLRRAVSDPRRADIGLCAASGTYYLFLSLGPLTALALSILPYTPVTETQLTEEALALAPAAFRQIIRAVAADVYAGSGLTLGLSLLLELWSGARFLASVVRGIAAVSGGSVGYLRRRLLGAGFTAVLLLFLLGDLSAQLFGRRLLALVRLRRPGGGTFLRAVLRLRMLLLPVGLTGLNALLFHSVSGRRGAGLPGALFSAGVWIVFARGYSWAMERFGLFGVYGSIAAVTVSLCWIYGSLYILFLGAWLNGLSGTGS